MEDNDNTLPRQPLLFSQAAQNSGEKGSVDLLLDVDTRRDSKARSTIQKAKDRAQMTAATSMSIVHVALLKDTLDSGRNAIKYYDYMLGLIISALVLQILAGLLSLYISLLRRYYAKYQDDLRNDCAKFFCPFSCQGQTDHYAEYDAFFEENLEEAKPISEDNQKGCLPFECLVHQLHHLDHRDINVYNIWCEKAINANIKFAFLTAEIKAEEEKIMKARGELYQWKAQRIGSSDLEVRNILTRLKDAQISWHQLNEQKKKLHDLKEQGEILRKRVELIEKEHVLKRVTFWQSILNVMLYIVFALNAFVVGFGLGNGRSRNASNSTATLFGSV